MTDELERIGKEAIVTYSRYFPGVSLKRLKKNPGHLSQEK
jgi:hypothetical protein